MQGTAANPNNAGRFEFLRIGGVVGDTVYFTTDKINFYGDNVGDDSNIGIATTGGSVYQQRVVIQRIPNYNNVTINGTLTSAGWNTYKNGVVAFRAAGTLSGSGTVNVNGLGYGSATGYAGVGVWGTHVGSIFGGGMPGSMAGTVSQGPGVGMAQAVRTFQIIVWAGTLMATRSLVYSFQAGEVGMVAGAPVVSSRQVIQVALEAALFGSPVRRSLSQEA